MKQEILVAVVKVEGLTKIPAVAGTKLPTCQYVEVDAENLNGDLVRFRRPTREAPKIGDQLRVTIEEVTT